MQKKKMTPGAKLVMLLLGLLAVALLALDIRELATGIANPNEHLPFLLPAAFGAFMCLVWVVDRRLN